MNGRWGELLNDQRSDGPEIARAYYTWAVLNHNLNLAEKTLKLWQQDYPQDPEPWGLTGLYHQSMNNWEGAEDAFRQALQLAPESDEYRLALANALQNRLKAADAMALYEQHLQRHPESLEAQHGIAQCAATKGDMETAVRVMRTALEAHPDDFSTQKLYGEILLSAGDAATAVTVLQKAHREVPEHANLAYALGRALKECGRGAEAEPLFAFMEECRPQLDQLLAMERELRRQPNNLTLRMQIAGITAKYVSRRDAIRWYQNILLVSPSYAPAHQALAVLYRLVGDEKLAEYHAAHATANSRPTNPGLTPDHPSASPNIETSKNP
jgi:Flp pilus assembly protein TadD